MRHLVQSPHLTGEETEAQREGVNAPCHKVSWRTNPGPDDPRPVLFPPHISGSPNLSRNGDHWRRGWANLTLELLVNGYLIGTKK